MNYDDIFIGNNLPKPLEKEELFEYIRKANLGDLEARYKVILHNMRLVLSQVLGKFVNTPYEKKELVSIGTVGLLKAVDTFDITKKIEFATYAIRCIDNEILMFIRKGKRYLEEESFDQPIFYGKDGDEIKLEDTILDEKGDFTKDVEERELLLEVRRQVDMLEGREKEIIKLYFGFYNDKQYSQKEIAELFGISRSFVSRIISKTVNKIREQLQQSGIIELRKKTQIAHSKEKGREKMARKPQTIYEYFSDYTKDEIDAAIEKLSKEDKGLITLRYGNDLNNPVFSKLTKKDRNRFYSSLIPKIKRLLSNPNQKRKIVMETKIQSTEVSKSTITLEKEENIIGHMKDTSTVELQPSSNNTFSKEECMKILEILRTPTFSQMLESVSVKEAIIISLKLGYVDGKFFSTEAIATFLGIDEAEVIETTKKVLLLYKTNINEFIDNVIRVSTGYSKSLSLKEKID